MRAMLGRDLVVSQVFLDNPLIAHIVDGDCRNFDTVGSLMRAVIPLEMERRAIQRDVKRLKEYYLPPARRRLTRTARARGGLECVVLSSGRHLGLRVTRPDLPGRAAVRRASTGGP